MKQLFEDTGCQTMQDSQPCKMENQRGKPSDRELPGEGVQVPAEEVKLPWSPAGSPRVGREQYLERSEGKINCLQPIVSKNRF